MNSSVATILILLSVTGPAFAHRLDEYLQAMMVSLEQDQIHATMRLIPGVAVSAKVIAIADSNGDRTFSEEEQRRYAKQVLDDVSLSVDGNALKARLKTVAFPTV